MNPLVRFVLATTLASACAPSLQAQANILLIVTDDQAPHTLSAYGNTVCKTPHIDALATAGMTLDGAHHMGSWSGAVCRPSRTMIMTGRTVWHIPRNRGRKGRNKPKTDSLVPRDIAQNSLPAVFNRAGYVTFRTCKRGNSYEAANKLFQVRRDATKRGNGLKTGSAWHGDQAVAFLRERRGQGPGQSQEKRKPFLMYLGFSHPHDARNGRPDLLAKYGAKNSKQPPTETDEKAPPLPINYLPAHPFHHGHPGLRDETKVPGVLRSRTVATIRNEIGREYACIENIDEQVGRVLEELKQLGELDNTYIVFTSDHGIAVGRHGLAGKQNLYEHTWRVPMIIRGPKIPSGTRALGNVYLLDLLPTLCQMAGIEAPATVEGKSFLPVLRQQRPIMREILFGVYSGGTKPGMRCVKKGPWKLIKYDVLESKVRETQLFNLAENPDELLLEHREEGTAALTGNKPENNQRDLAEDPKYAEKLKEMEALLLAEQRRLDDPHRLWNQK